MPLQCHCISSVSRIVSNSTVLNTGDVQIKAAHPKSIMNDSIHSLSECCLFSPNPARPLLKPYRVVLGPKHGLCWPNYRSWVAQRAKRGVFGDDLLVYYYELWCACWCCKSPQVQPKPFPLKAVSVVRPAQPATLTLGAPDCRRKNKQALRSNNSRLL